MNGNGPISQPTGRLMILMGCGITGLFSVVVAAAIFCGLSGRSYSGRNVMERLNDSSAAIEIWSKYGVRGRTLLLFDGKLNAETSRDAEVTNTNYVDAAINKNIIRKVIHIVPDERWDEASKNLLASGVVLYSDGAFSATIDGAPLKVTTMDAFSPIEETVLVHINGDGFSSKQREKIKELVSSPRLNCDIVTISGASPF